MTSADLTDPLNLSRRACLRTVSSRWIVALPLLGLGACSTQSSGPAGTSWPAPAPRSAGAPPPSGTVSGSPAASGNPAAPPGDASAPTAPALPPIMSEKRWLDEWFAKTPVVIRQLNDTTLQLTVPMANSFDVGQLPPRPALIAVLDRLVESLRRQATARLTVIVAPDTGAPTSQAVSRAQRVAEHLASRKIAAQRIITSRTGVPGAPVQLQLQLEPPPAM